MQHPNQVQLALMAGNDLGPWDRWRVRRHVASCANCSSEVQALRTASEQVREVTAELPENLNWNQLAEEMAANVRVGLAAGEAIARFDRPSLTGRPRNFGWNAAMVLACATVVFGCRILDQSSASPDGSSSSALGRVRVDRIGKLVQHPVLAPEDVMLEAFVPIARSQPERSNYVADASALGCGDGVGQHARFGGRTLRRRGYRPSHDQ